MKNVKNPAVLGDYAKTAIYMALLGYRPILVTDFIRNKSTVSLTHVLIVNNIIPFSITNGGKWHQIRPTNIFCSSGKYSISLFSSVIKQFTTRKTPDRVDSGTNFERSSLQNIQTRLKF